MFLNRIMRRWRTITNKDVVEEQLDDELRYHLERDTARNIESGMSPEDARYEALKTFGGVDQSKEECRDAWGVRLVENILQDIRYSIRLIIKNPTFSLLAILTLMLGIGANTAIFSLLDAVMLRSLAVREPDRLVLFGKAESGGASLGFPNDSCDLFSYPFYVKTREHKDVFEDVASQLSMTWTVHGKVNNSGDPEKLDVQLVSGNYFSLLGINASHGRMISEEEDKTIGAHPVAVVSYAWWQNHLGNDPAAIGKTIQIEDVAYTIIGVAPRNFIGTTIGEAPNAWIPLAMEPKLPPAHWKTRDKSMFRSLYLIGRLRNGVDTAQANASVNLLFKQFLQQEVGAQPSDERVQDIQRASIELTPAGKGLLGIRRDFAMPLKILMGIVAVVLLISCANVANLFLARAASRQKEFGVRMALGANRIQLIRQMLIESLMIAVLGAIGGIVIAWWGSSLLIVMASTQAQALPLDVSPNIKILAFTLLTAFFSVLIFGVAPALRSTKLDLNSGLKDGKGTVHTTSQSRLAKSFVVAQVALSLLLMIGAGLFVRTLINLQSIPTGFNQQNATIFMIDTSTAGLKDEEYPALMREVEDRVRNIPGVQANSFSFFVFNQGGWSNPVITRDESTPQGEARDANQNLVGDEWFTAMGVPLIAGRTFTRTDTDKSQNVAVVSETFAQRFYPNVSPIGKRFGPSEKEKDKWEIVGVVKDVKYHSLTENPKPMVYYPHSQGSQAVGNFVVRFTGPADSVIKQIRQTIRSVNNNLPVDEVVTLSDHVNRSLVQQTLTSRLALFFGLLALMVSCIGLYGVLSYSVTQRRNEIGVRMALGASTFEVLKLVLGDGLKLTLIGVVLGLASAYGLTRLVKTLLFGVKSLDLVTFVGVAGLLILVSLIASYIPARRATKVDPLIALRSE